MGVLTCTVSSEGEEEYFSDASEGRRRTSRPVTPSSPIPKTRIEKIDDTPSHGEVPGTPAYDKRTADAVPDEVEILFTDRLSAQSLQLLDPATALEGSAIPRTVVEKVDPESPSHGEIPGTSAYLQRQMDAAPDVVLKTPEAEKTQDTEGDSNNLDRPASTTSTSIPETVITRVDSKPAHGEVPGTEAYEKRVLDAAPDILEIKDTTSGKPSV